jgi:hypothetical protein
MPACELFVSIFCNRPRDQKLLAWLCAELAARFDGMVDLGGPLPLPDRSEWARTGLAGAVVDVPPEVDTGPWSHAYVVDAAFLRGWIHQPNFHMIK